MKKRLDGIYKCDHAPYSYIQGGAVFVRCMDCPAEIRPSDLTVGQLISFTDIRLQKMCVNKDTNSFELVGRVG